MKLDPIPLVSLAALTLMTGAVISHWLGVDERLELALLRAKSSDAVLVIEQSPEFGTASVESSIATHQAPPASPAARALSIPPDLQGSFVRALESIEQMHRNQDNLRDQVAETNRDLMELQFRVDSHSESFRPLRATQESEVPAGNGVLPPLETP